LICLIGPNDMVLARGEGGELALQPRSPKDAAAIVPAVAPTKRRREWLMSSCSAMALGLHQVPRQREASRIHVVRALDLAARAHVLSHWLIV
jgi:hypothetical protein